MTEAIIVFNAGSTSLKFGAYALDANKSLPLLCRGGINGMQADPHFIANDAAGKPLDATPGARAPRSITRPRCNSSSPGWRRIPPARV